MKIHLAGQIAFFFFFTMPLSGQPISWELSPPLFSPGGHGTFDEVAVKDPSIVFWKGQWHLFYTARSKEEYTTGYVAASSWDELDQGRRQVLSQIRGKTRYGCAPQVFYFSPQARWYLIAQTEDANYQPVFATTQDVSDPGSWTPPLPLLAKDEAAKWIDFWVICDTLRAYLFYTQAHQGVMVRTTTLSSFPQGWGPARKVMSEVHEAVHVYKVKGREAYHMIFELNHSGIRSFGLAVAGSLEGPWHRVQDHYATGQQLSAVSGGSLWTDMVSHGEAIRTGFDQHLEYDPENVRWLIQGLDDQDLVKPYPALPWKLGIISRKDDLYGED